MPLPRVRPCSERAGLKTFDLETAWAAVGASELMIAHIQRLSVLLLTHMSRSISPYVGTYLESSGDRAIESYLFTSAGGGIQATGER